MKLKKYIFKNNLNEDINYLNEDINYLDEDINFLISMSTYPRNFKSTKLLIKESLDTLLADLPINFKPFLLIVGDDYDNIYFELKDLIDEYNIKYEIHNINKNNALRDYNCNKELKWQHACTRSLIHSYEFSLNKNFDYIMTISDDDKYSSSYFKNILNVISSHSEVDLIFSAGIYLNKTILPRKLKRKTIYDYPLPCDTIATGITFNSKNKIFIKDIIQLLKNRWDHINNNLDKSDIPQDALMWDYLSKKFKAKIYRSYFIKKVLVFHDTEQTIFKNFR